MVSAHRRCCFILVKVKGDTAGLSLKYILAPLSGAIEKVQQEMKGVGGDATSVKLNLTDPCCILPCQYHGCGMQGRRAGSPIAVYARVQCREPKTGQQKVQFYCEDDILFLSSYYLSMSGAHPQMLS